MVEAEAEAEEAEEEGGLRRSKEGEDGEDGVHRAGAGSKEKEGEDQCH